jgi:hypothetical protein
MRVPAVRGDQEGRALNDLDYNLVIPGHREAMSLDVQLHIRESIAPVLEFGIKRYHREYGFRVRATRAPE